ncbi:MAG TPA: family 2 glycosyl transferase [Gemmatimonas aurantiaca]|uniref:Family 2 glycosyl transferase n=2 Tax=Gemmatimonas aurantiaca TaxID=173480 RepID=A0A3D4V6A9_9BACT|nr:family 2 glycosyl transferase [Gemmatimonas aurantiaca]
MPVLRGEHLIMPPLVLVVPCFNEAARLDGARFIEAVDRYPWLQLLFVNDGSTDNTEQVLRALQDQRATRIACLHLARNGGKAEAVRQGLLQVQVSTHEDGLCGFWDADLSAPLTELVALRETLERRPDVQWVWGIRLRALGRQVTRRPLRHYLGRLFATCSSIVLGIDSYDTQCGAKLFRNSALLRTVLAEPFRSRWIFDVELLTRAQGVLAFTKQTTLEQAVYEQPLGHWEHRAGSKVRSADFVNALRELLVIRNARAHWHRACD